MALYPDTSPADYVALHEAIRRNNTTCPVCGERGYTWKGFWVEAHLFHEKAPCGKVVTRRGLKNHIHRCSECAPYRSLIRPGFTIEPRFKEQTHE